jgi:hypothetical protein
MTCELRRSINCISCEEVTALSGASAVTVTVSANFDIVRPMSVVMLRDAPVTSSVTIRSWYPSMLTFS